jgi:hypothetical protein
MYLIRFQSNPANRCQQKINFAVMPVSEDAKFN